MRDYDPERHAAYYGWGGCDFRMTWKEIAAVVFFAACLAFVLVLAG